MRGIFKFIIGLFFLLLVAVHLFAAALFFFPVPKLLNASAGHSVDYVRLSDLPPYIKSAFAMPDGWPSDFSLQAGPLGFAASKILALRAGKFLDEGQRHELYLNSLDFGADIIGLQAASYYYYKKPVKDLSAEEALTLAGVYKIFR